MRTGILGGTLDPIHNGHLAIAKAAMAALKLDRVIVMPSGNPPHKPMAALAEDRLHMAALATRGVRGLSVSDMEIGSPGHTYTVDTLMRLTMECPGEEWVYILGADALNILDKWREFPRIARLCGFAAVSRPGCDEALTRLRAQALRSAYGAKVELLPVSGPEISSTRIRKMVAAGEDISALVPKAVAEYIARRGLYLCDYSEAEILKILRAELTPHRYAHTLGVANTAQELAGQVGVDPMRARLAGLLHDCAKSMPLDEMRALVLENVPDMDQEELVTKAILHAPAGMALAQKRYGVRDPQILSAIRKHTVGDGCMSAMDALIYVADFIEPGRDSFPGLDKARRLARRDVFGAMCYSAELSVRHLKDCGQKAHPRTLALLKNYGS